MGDVPMNRREFLKINLAGAVAAFTGLPALAEEPALAQGELGLWYGIRIRPFAGDYTPLSMTTLADMRQVEADRAVMTHYARNEKGEWWVTYESGCTQTLYGWFAEVDEKLIAAERFDRSFDVTASDQLTFQVTLT